MPFPSTSASLVTLLAALTLLGCKGASRGESATAAAADAAPAAGDSTIARADQNRIRGVDTAQMWIIEISDFQCPFCATWHQQVYGQLNKELVDAGKVRFAYINYPLPSHRNAWPAAITAMCASAQGHFWPVHDALFETQNRWETLAQPQSFLDSLAVAHGADAVQLRACTSSEATRSLVQGDMDRAIQAGVNATPSFLVGGGNSWTKLSGVQPLTNIQQALEDERAKRRGGAGSN
jgi:protein-disulfide isomerase